MQLTVGEYAISKEAPCLRVWPKTCPAGTESRRADACQLSLGEQLALGVPVVTKEWHKRTWNCCFFSGMDQFPMSAFGLQCCTWLPCEGRVVT